MTRLRNFVYWKVAVCLLVAGPAFAQAREGVPTLSGYMEVHLNKEQDLPCGGSLASC